MDISELEALYNAEIVKQAELLRLSEAIIEDSRDESIFSVARINTVRVNRYSRLHSDTVNKRRNVGSGRVKVGKSDTSVGRPRSIYECAHLNNRTDYANGALENKRALFAVSDVKNKAFKVRVCIDGVMATIKDTDDRSVAENWARKHDGVVTVRQSDRTYR